METIKEKIITEIIDIPIPPPVAKRILLLLNNETFSINELQELIFKDQALTTRILRLANSPFYRKNGEISTISNALIIMGTDAIKPIILAAVLKNLYSHFGYYEKLLWEHNIEVSVISSLIAEEIKMSQTEKALIAGITHDVGKAALNNSLQSYKMLMQKSQKENIPIYEIENAMLGFSHCDVGVLIAQKWGLPQYIEKIISAHHSDTLESLDKETEMLCRIVKIANAVSHHINSRFEGCLNIYNIAEEQLRLDKATVDKIAETSRKTCNEQVNQLLTI